MIKFWTEVSSSIPLTASSILSESIWNNSFLQIGNNTISPSLFHNKIKSLFIADLFYQTGKILSWNCFKLAHNINEIHYFHWMQIINAVPAHWKNCIKIDKGRSRIFCEFRPHLIVNAKLFPMEKLSSRELYNILIKTKFKPPTSQQKFHSLFKVNTLPWKKNYILPKMISIDSYSRIFQYKCLNNILYLNNALHRMGFSDTPLCSYCGQVNETMQHLFLDCSIAKSLWLNIRMFFKKSLDIPILDLQSAILGFIDTKKDNLALNNILLIYKLCLYRFRDKKCPVFNYS